MGTALIRFSTVIGDRDAAVGGSPYFIGDSVLRFVNEDNGINKRSSVLTHDVWCMLLNYPQELWEPESVMRTFVPFGRFLVWNKDMSNKARILVKFRAHNIDTLPLSVVVGKNVSNDGHTDTWSCPLILLSTTMLGGHAGDEDPIPPNGANPHPMPLVHAGFWHDLNVDHQMNEIQVAHDQADAPVGNAPVPEMNINPATPVQDDNFIPVPEAEQEPTTITHLTNLISKIMDTDVDHEMLQKLAVSQINGATINLEESEVNGVEVMKCLIEINTMPTNYAPPVEPTQQTLVPQTNNSDSDVVVISEPAHFNKQKRKQAAPRDVSTVRRSRRIANKTVGYKDKASASAAISIKGVQPLNLGSRFEATVNDQQAAPPTGLPTETMQAIGTKFCQIPPGEVSYAALNYDSSDE
jgi:hypothetical protein